MLGITTPDAIAFGTLVLAVLAAWTGRKSGDAAKAAAPPPVTPLSLGMASFADTGAMMQLVAVLTKLVEVQERGIEASDRRHTSKTNDQLNALSDKIDHLTDRRR